MDWQAELVAIPAPPFGEQARSEWLAARFAEAGLSEVETDALGNVFGWLPAASLPPESTGPVVVLSAHLDTVFPAGTPLNPVVGGDRLQAPGACDNGAGVAGMLAIAHALVKAKVELAAPLIFLGNVGEEGEGDLRGVRHLYQPERAGRPHRRAHCAGRRGRGLGRYPGPGQPPLPGHRHRPRRAQLYRCGHAQPDCRAGLGAGCTGRDATAGGAAHHAQSGHDPRRHQRELHPRERAGIDRFPLHQLGSAPAAGGRLASRRGRRRGALECAGKIGCRAWPGPAGL